MHAGQEGTTPLAFSSFWILNFTAIQYPCLFAPSPQLCELAYQMTNDVDKLLFLYLLTGNREKAQKLLAEPAKRSDLSARCSHFHGPMGGGG